MLLGAATRNFFFTGKGGVGKTSVACAHALALAESGRRILVVSTDPASNLDEVFGVPLGMTPRMVVEGLWAMNLDPEAAARAYREKVVGPYRGVLPAAALRSIEEQLSGACTVEIAAFDEFARLLGRPEVTQVYDHVVFDTAPTGHTLRLLELPAAWSGFLEVSSTASCLGPLAGLAAQKDLYDAARRVLADRATTTLVLVSRPERGSLEEIERTRRELGALGVTNLALVVNGIYPGPGVDATAAALAARGRAALETLPPGLAALPRVDVPLRGFEILGLDSLRALAGGAEQPSAAAPAERAPALPALTELVDALEAGGPGVIMTVGKGGVGKSRLAASIAAGLAARGHAVHLTTTDPAGGAVAGMEGVTVSRIDPAEVTRLYADEVLAVAGAQLGDAARHLLEEDLRSPCTQEIAVFRAFARVVAEGATGWVVVDTAPTGHTLLLLASTAAFHREVARSTVDVPEEVMTLLPRLRDSRYTRVVVVALPEATPLHEAAALQADLRRAEIEPFAWVMNQTMSALSLRDPLLLSRQRTERRYLQEASTLARRLFAAPWTA